MRYSRIMGVLLLRDLKVLNFMFTGVAVAMLGYALSELLGIREVLQSMTLKLFVGVPYSSLALILGIMFLFIVALADTFDLAKDQQERPPET